MLITSRTPLRVSFFGGGTDYPEYFERRPGAVIGMAARRPSAKPQREIVTLAVGSALGLAGIDVVYVAKRRIRPVYLLDALAEVLLAGAWLIAVQVSKDAQA